MKKIYCEICGSSDIVKQENIFKCSDCGKEYSVEEIENKTQEKETSTQQQNTNNSIVEILDNSIQPNESNNPQENEEGKNDALPSLLMGLAILIVIFIISSIVLTISESMTEKKNKITSCISTVMSQKIGNKHFDIEEKNGSFYVSWSIDDINIEAKVKVNFSDTGHCDSLELIDIKKTSNRTFGGRYAADVGEVLGLKFSSRDTVRM